MILETVEAALALRLSHYLKDKGVAIAPFPDDTRNFGRAVPRGQILIGYRNSTFRVIAENPLTCEMNANFEVFLQLQNLRSHTGAYPLLDWVRFALLGFIPIAGPAKGLRPSNEKFDDLDDNGMWSYTQTWTLPLVVVTGQDLYEALPIPVSSDPVSQVLDPPPFVVTSIGVGVWRNKVNEVPDSDAAQLDREWEDVL